MDTLSSLFAIQKATECPHIFRGNSRYTFVCQRYDITDGVTFISHVEYASYMGAQCNVICYHILCVSFVVNRIVVKASETEIRFGKTVTI